MNEIPIRLRDFVGDPVTSLVGATLEVSKSGEAFIAATGTTESIGDGVWLYRPSSAEQATGSFILLHVVQTGAVEYFMAARPGGGIHTGETDPTKLKIPFVLVDASGLPVDGIELTGSEVQVSFNGDPWADALGSFEEISDGGYYLNIDPSEIPSAGSGVLLVKLVDAGGIAETIVWGETIQTAEIEESEEPDLGDPLPAAIEHGEPEYYDHIERALNRLAYQFRDNP